jgi:Ca-activated chloride channel family protein
VVPRIAGTVVLAFDVSASMAARDVAPSRLAASQAAARRFVEAQPDSVDIGVVTFGSGALTTQEPSSDHAGALAAIGRLRPGGATSLGQAILVSLSAIVGEPVAVPSADPAVPGSGVQPPDLGYWGSATIVVLSDGENTTGPDAEEAAALAAAAGVHVETIGVGTVQGATVDVDGFQVATALDEALLTRVAQATNGSYHPARDAAQLDDVYRSLDLRNVAHAQPVEFTAALVLAAVALLLLGGALMVRWHGRLV